MIDCRERVFFICAQALEAPSKNASAYNAGSSGPIIYTYAGGNPVSSIDPDGLLEYNFAGGAFGAFGAAYSAFATQVGQGAAQAGGFNWGAIASAGAIGALNGFLNPTAGISTGAVAPATIVAPFGSAVLGRVVDPLEPKQPNACEGK